MNQPRPFARAETARDTGVDAARLPILFYASILRSAEHEASGQAFAHAIGRATAVVW
jgi:hypothetical protein